METLRRKPDEIVLLKTFSSDADAHIAQMVLEAHGIVSAIDNATFSRIYPIGFSDLGGLRLMVFERDRDNALKILERHADDCDNSGL